MLQSRLTQSSHEVDMFNSPLQYCPVCKQQVALDQKREECAHEQHCEAENCPLSHLFVSSKTSSDVDDNEKKALDTNTRIGMESYLP
jgi:hypothetical protein